MIFIPPPETGNLFGVCVERQNHKRVETKGNIKLHHCVDKDHGIMDNAEMYGTHQGHRVQLLAMYRTRQESLHVPKSIVQTLLQLCQAWCCEHYSGLPGEMTVLGNLRLSKMNEYCQLPVT